LWTDKNRARYDRDHLRYPSDLTDDEWAYVEPLIPPARRGGGKRRVDMRGISKLHLAWGLALWFEEMGARHENGCAHRSRRRYVQPVDAIQVLHPARRVFRSRSRHRVDDYWCLLAPKFIDRADADASQVETWVNFK
jgi:transposase